MPQTRQTEEFAQWLAGLKGTRAYARVLSRILQIQSGSRGDWKSVGDGVWESRIASGPGYRLYCTTINGELVILLAGGDKSTQAKDIKRAKQLAKNL